MPEHRRLDVSMCSDDRDRRVRLVILNPLYEAQPIAVWKSHVSETQVERSGAQLACCCRDRIRRRHVEVHALERDLQELADVGVVVDDEGVGGRPGS